VHALKLLDHDRGIMQCDGYAAYKSIAGSTNGEAITLAFCWAHLRRGFFDIAKGGNAPIASEALERIAALYAIEKPIRGKSAGERRAVRQEKSKPLVLELKTWLEQQLTRVSGGCGFLFGRDGFILTVTASQRLANWGTPGTRAVGRCRSCLRSLRLDTVPVQKCSRSRCVQASIDEVQ
jgi:Transposase IS66 family